MSDFTSKELVNEIEKIKKLCLAHKSLSSSEYAALEQTTFLLQKSIDNSNFTSKKVEDKELEILQFSASLLLQKIAIYNRACC
jgi:hypothetical protein